MNMASNFVKEVTARLKGDADGVVAAKNERKATAAVKGQIAALQSSLVNAESAVEEATEALNTAKYPTTLIGEVDTYVRNVASKKEQLDLVTDELEATKKSIKFFEDLLKEF